MDKSCKTCRYYNLTKCTRTLPLVNTTKLGCKYSEEGLLAEALRENLDIKEVVMEVIHVLNINDMLKVKAREWSKLDFEDAEVEIHDRIDNALYESLSNYFDGSCATHEIEDPDNFYCSYWI